MIRTTITLPEDLYEQLRTTAFLEKKSLSELIRNKILRSQTKKLLKPGEGIKKMASRYTVKNFKPFNRKEFYDEIVRHKMSFGL